MNEVSASEYQAWLEGPEELKTRRLLEDKLDEEDAQAAASGAPTETEGVKRFKALEQEQIAKLSPKERLSRQRTRLFSDEPDEPGKMG